MFSLGPFVALSIYYTITLSHSSMTHLLWLISSVLSHETHHKYSLSVHILAVFLVCDPLQNTFVGLTNLGATCYVNTFLQVWFHNLELRRSIYQCHNSRAEAHDTESGTTQHEIPSILFDVFEKCLCLFASFS